MGKIMAEKPARDNNLLFLMMVCLQMLAITFSCFQIQAQTIYKFDFGISTNPPLAGYTKATPANKYTAAYDNDNTNGTFGFENWYSTAFGAFSRGSTNDNLNRDFIYAKPHGGGFSSFYFSVRVPEGKYTVTFYIGDPGDTSTTTIKAESRRLLVENLHLAKGQLATRTFTVIRREPAIAGGGSVSLDYSHGREDPSICLDWDHKLTFEFSGARPCIGGLDIVPVDSGITFHLCGNSTIVEQEDEPWSCWGQFIHRFYNSGIIINDLGSSGLQSSSFKNQKRLAKICSVMKPGDYLFFEFGHNEDATDAGRATFKQNMQTYYDSATKHQATMVFVTPTARHADTDPATSVGQFAQNTRDYAKALTGSKVVDLNASVLDMKTALANSAYGSDNTAIYCHVSASPQWPDQPAVNDGTHFCDFGGYELAKWVAQTGMKAAGIDLQKYLLDTAAFDPNKPDFKSAWSFPYSLDTVFRHSTPGATVYKDTVSAVTGLLSGGNAQSFPHSISINLVSLALTYSVSAAGNADFGVFSMNGKVVARKLLTIEKTGSIAWKDLGNLPTGIYFIRMKVNGSEAGKNTFLKL